MEEIKDRSMIVTIVASCAIVVAATVIVVLYRFTDLLTFTPTEKSIARKLDLNDPLWVDTLLELSLPPFKKDFPVFSTFFYSDDGITVSQIYATMAKLDDIRAHYLALLENSGVSETDDVAVLDLEGECKGRNVTVTNYFSEVSNLIQVEMEMSGEYADIIRQKVVDSFPVLALSEVPEIAAFTSGRNSEGYVMYSSNAFASDVFADVPLFSRAYSFDGTLDELRRKIDSLSLRSYDAAVIDNGIAEIKNGAWLYQVKALQSITGVKVILVIQAIPGK